tara:strand:+ start:423 stop:833 length:411 start_codon:yes stop_codon:yes gene_type:complete
MNWIDFMPSLPMVLGLPVTRRDGGTGIIIGLDHASLNNGVFHVLQTDEPTESSAWGSEGWGVNWTRLDLGHPQGFAYAMQLYAEHDYRANPSAPFLWLMSVDNWPQVVDRHLTGTTTDDDRVALAQVLEAIHGGEE